MNKQQRKIILYLTCIVTFVVLMVFLASCTTMKTTKLYEGQQLSEDKIARLISKEDGILVHSVDGVKSPDGKETYGPSKLELPPGDHVLVVSFRRNFSRTTGSGIVYYRSSSTNNVAVRFRTEAGHTYILKAEHDPKRKEWFAIVLDETQKRKIVEVGPQPSKTVQTYVVRYPPKGR